VGVECQKYVLVLPASPSITRTHRNTDKILIQQHDIKEIAAQANLMKGKAEKRSRYFILRFMNVNYYNATSV